MLCIDFYEFFNIFHPSGSPFSPHLLCCMAFAVAYYSFTPCAFQLRRNRQLQVLGNPLKNQGAQTGLSVTEIPSSLKLKRGNINIFITKVRKFENTEKMMYFVLSFSRVFVILFYLFGPHETFEENSHDQTVSVH